MVDPFRTVAIRERAAHAVCLGALIAFICALSYVFVRPYVAEGRIVRAEVLRVGMHPAAEGMGGDLPILTVRLPDGSVRQVTSSWAAISNCIPGRWISLLQRGTSVQVGSPGCQRTR